MAREILPYVVIFLIFVCGAVLYKKSFGNEVGLKYSRDAALRNVNKITQKFKKEFSNDQTDALLKQAGIKMSAFLFQFLRYSILAVLLAYITYIRFSRGVNVNLFVVLWLIIFIGSRPSENLLNFKSPFFISCGLINKKHKSKCNVEIDSCFSQLKNMAISMSQKEKALSSDYIIREITKYTKVTKPYFSRLSGFCCDGRYEEGQQYFINSIGTESSKSLAGLLVKLDFIQPSEFVSQIELYQSQMGEQRKTGMKKTREAQGNIVFLIALISGFTILINFLVIVIGIDTVSMLQKVSF